MIEQLRGKWALVTGASSGIGMAFSRELAAKGVNIVMVARREKLLQELAHGLETEFGVSTFVVPADLGQAGAASVLKDAVEKESVQISLLVNNAGSGKWGRFEDASVDTYEKMLQLNTAAMVALCREFFPDLAAMSPAAVINVSSQAALQPVPYMAVYAASKAFVLNFSQALWGEWREHGIEVQALIPGPTETEFDSKAGAYESAVVDRGTPQAVVEASFRSLGKGKPVVSSVGGIFKQEFFSAMFPRRFVINTVAGMFKPPKQS